MSIASQADAAIGQGQAGGEDETEGMGWIDKQASLARRERFGQVGLGEDIWGGLVGALLAADPLGSAVVIIMAIAEEAITEGTERVAVLIIAPFEAGERLVIACVVQEADGADGLQVVMDVAQDFLVTFTGIS
ncbi:MAG: hypothetical protein LLG42_06545 [Chloroflexi bacterium]|nr:hypothetical protein [Chloroflexota bacterium]